MAEAQVAVGDAVEVGAVLGYRIVSWDGFADGVSRAEKLVLCFFMSWVL